MTGYRLLLVPEDSIKQTEAGKAAGTAYVAARHGGTQRTLTGPFEVVADVTEDRKLRMSRTFYDEIEVVDP